MNRPHAHRALSRPLSIIERTTLAELRDATAALTGNAPEAVTMLADGRVILAGRVDPALRWEDPRPHCCRLMRVA